MIKIFSSIIICAKLVGADSGEIQYRIPKPILSDRFCKVMEVILAHDKNQGAYIESNKFEIRDKSGKLLGKMNIFTISQENPVYEKDAIKKYDGKTVKGYEFVKEYGIADLLWGNGQIPFHVRNVFMVFPLNVE